MVKKLPELRNFSINYGHLYDGEKLVDEVLLNIMTPNTYTKEDIVEINCHRAF